MIIGRKINFRYFFWFFNMRPPIFFTTKMKLIFTFTMPSKNFLLRLNVNPM